MPRARINYQTATLDFETDPFRHGRIPRPFAVELYNPEISFTAWGDDCVEKLMSFLEMLETPLRIYAHNGGKFDFFFLYTYLDNPIRIINSRIVSCKLFHHQLRDSFAIIPVPLRAYAKDDIDYNLLERHRREKHKQKILSYLHTDCVKLYDLVSAFLDRFGPMLTIGSTAMKEIQSRYQFDTLNGAGDDYFRHFYYGGRVQCFRSGLLRGPFKGIDINSAYPYVMAHRRHPVNGHFNFQRTLPESFDVPYFAHIRARNRDALPWRETITNDDGTWRHDGPLRFDVEEGDFYACSHEIEVALEFGLIDIIEVYEVAVAQEFITFEEFINEFYAEKVAAAQSGDKISYIFAKLLQNSGYGKFGQNPANYKDWFINRDFGNDDELAEFGYKIESEYEEFELWSKPATIKETSYYDVSIAASITSATRALLLRGIQLATDPVYCDTDSLICRDFKGTISPTELGAWKHEFTAPAVAIAGKKLYMAYDPDKPLDKAYDPKGGTNPVKLASKGGLISPQDLLDIANGGNFTHRNEAPTFSLHNPTRFQTRIFRKTVDNADEEEETD